jgi:hypothetical protein
VRLLSDKEGKLKDNKVALFVVCLRKEYIKVGEREGGGPVYIRKMEEDRNQPFEIMKYMVMMANCLGLLEYSLASGRIRVWQRKTCLTSHLRKSSGQTKSWPSLLNFLLTLDQSQSHKVPYLKGFIMVVCFLCKNRFYPLSEFFIFYDIPYPHCQPIEVNLRMRSMEQGKNFFKTIQR